MHIAGKTEAAGMLLSHKRASLHRLAACIERSLDEIWQEIASFSHGCLHPESRGPWLLAVNLYNARVL
jgi:hypothetical protein